MRRSPILIFVLVLLPGCGRGPAKLVNTVKEIPLSSSHDTIFAERSNFWDAGKSETARIDSNRQSFTFKPSAGDILVVTLRNMGGVPLKRDTIRRPSKTAAESFLRTGTMDTNMHMTIEHANSKLPETDIIIFIRNRDSVYKEFLFYER